MRLKFRLSNGKKTFFQWDVNQKIILENPICTQVHFENKDISDKAYVKEVYKDNEGRSVVDIPDIFLQYTPGFLFYGYVISEDGKERYTEERGDVSVIRRAKPSDYVFTPEDQKTLEEVFDDAVKYIPEKKTDEEKANARENIGAESVKNKVSEIGDDDGTHYPTVGAVKAELDKKIDNPQAASIGEVLTVEEVDENGKPTKWKTAPAAAEQVQSDWYEQDPTKPSYIKNGFAKLKFTKKEAPSRSLTTEGYYHYTVSTPSGGTSSYVCYQLSVLIAPDTYDTIYVDIVPTDETATLNNIKVAIEEFGKRYDITNVSISYGHDPVVYYITPKDNPVLVYICGVIVNSEIDVRFLPSPDFNTDYAGIFKASPVTDRAELKNLKPVKYYNSYTNPDATTSEKFPSLYAQKEIKTFDTFDFNTTVLGQGSSDKFSLCYTSNIGNACTELGITEDDLPIMSYLMDYLVGNRPLGTYYIETATNKRFIATYRYGTTTWSDIKKLSGGSSGGSSAFYINITSTTDDSGNTTYSADKTADEIIAAYESGAVIIGVYGKIYMQCLMHIANPHELALTFAVQDFDPFQGVMARWWCSVDINKDNKEMDVSYEQNVTIPDEGIFFMVNNDTVQTSGSFEDIFHHIVSAVEIPKSLDMILIKGAEIYNLSRLETNDNGILFKFDDVANSKTYIVFGDSNNEAFTYSEEPLSTSVNITYNEETGNLQIGG